MLISNLHLLSSGAPDCAQGSRSYFYDPASPDGFPLCREPLRSDPYERIFVRCGQALSGDRGGDGVFADTDILEACDQEEKVVAVAVTATAVVVVCCCCC